MKTLIVCSEAKINSHVGEYYDEVYEVPHQPIATGIEADAKAIRALIENLWKQDVDEGTEDPCVQIHLDAASPYNAMLIDYQVVLGDAGIKIELPYLPTAVRTTEDEEALEVFKKLDRRGKE